MLAIALVGCERLPTPAAGVDASHDGAAVLDGADGAPDGSAVCVSDHDCADGDFCTGIERCDPTALGADVRGCVRPAAGPCGTAACVEATRNCESTCPPADSFGNCAVDGDCEDHVLCNGSETCDQGHCVRSPPPPCGAGATCVEFLPGCVRLCDQNVDCQDGLFCNGEEVCAGGYCQSSPSIPCPTAGDCDESARRCTACATNSQCDDGLYCNGIEACGPANTCLTGLLVPCTGRPCLEDADRCGCTTDAACDDGSFCDGAERCVGGACQPGVPPCPTYLPGTSTVACNAATRTCAPVNRQCRTAAECWDGSGCNGAEECAPGAVGANAFGCVLGTPPCPSLQVCTVDARGVVTCSATCGTPDADHDSHASSACGGDDCDDQDPEAYPGNPERCDGALVSGRLAADHDEDCNPCTVFNSLIGGDGDADHDGLPSDRCTNRWHRSPPVGCDPIVARVRAVSEIPSQVVTGADCNDDPAAGGTEMHPGVPEVCDGRDNNCDGQIDEGVALALYLDEDHDGVGAQACVRRFCPGTPGFAPSGGDCNDADPRLVVGSQQCGDQLSSTEVWVCGADGAWTGSLCTGGTQCVAQPNGLGACQ